MMQKIKVWDLPTRAFHWTLVLLCLCGWISFKFGDVGLVWHRWNGYAVLTLVLFRLAWGVVGTSTARFAGFLVAPWRALGYLGALLRGTDDEHLGHNPAGGWMVMVLVGGLLCLAGCGLFATDDIMTEGPLAHLVPSAVESLLTRIHKLLFWTMAGLVAVHVAAVLFHQFVKRENLIGAMISGVKSIRHLPANLDTAVRMASPWLALLCLAGAAGTLAAVLALGS